MGAYSSTHLTREEIQELEDKTHFSSKEIEQLYHRFKKLDRSRKGVISRQDFQLLSELSLNPMSQRLLSLFQTDGGESALSVGDGVTFDCFVRTLDYFNPATPSSVKLRALFGLYDLDRDGRVSERDLRGILRQYVGAHISEPALRVMARNTMAHALEACGNCKDEADEKDEAKAGGKQRSAVSPLSRNNIPCDDLSPGSDALAAAAECEGRSLSFEQFSRAIGVDALEAMNVAIPIRE